MKFLRTITLNNIATKTLNRRLVGNLFRVFEGTCLSDKSLESFEMFLNASICNSVTMKPQSQSPAGVLGALSDLSNRMTTSHEGSVKISGLGMGVSLAERVPDQSTSQWIVLGLRTAEGVGHPLGHSCLTRC